MREDNSAPLFRHLSSSSQREKQKRPNHGSVAWRDREDLAKSEADGRPQYEARAYQFTSISS